MDLLEQTLLFQHLIVVNITSSLLGVLFQETVRLLARGLAPEGHHF